MISPEYLLQLYAYYYWANRLVMATAENLSPEQLHRPQGHSWGSIHGVLVHMTNAEWIWLQRWKGISPAAQSAETEFPDLQSVRERWTDLEAEKMAFIHNLTPVQLQTEVIYTNTRGNTYHLPLWQLMVHIPNHGAHHRGELAAMFAMMDIPHTEEDWLFYFLYTSHQRAL